MLTRRGFLATSAMASLATQMPRAFAQEPATTHSTGTLPPAIAALPSFAGRVAPFTLEERVARIHRAQELMLQKKIGAILIANNSSSSLYFADMRGGGSERLMLIALLANGKHFILCPAFETDRMRESIDVGPMKSADLLTWQEDESPFALTAKGLRDRGITGSVGIDENMKFVFSDSIAKAAPQLKFVSATPITAGCRSIKTDHEVQCTRTAGAATLAVYEAVYKSLSEGMTTRDVQRLVTQAYDKVGLRGEASLNIDEYTALPHGSRTPQRIRSGSILMMDDGCVVEGYTSDITRTFVLGKPTDKQKKVFDTVLRAQTAALKAARPGVVLGEIDRAARSVVEQAGYGMHFSAFTHRVGHGMGLDMHEWPYFVENNMFGEDRAPRLAAGMTLSDEPGIYLKGEFGVRLEDDLHVTADGAELLTPQSPSLEEPFAKI